MARRQDRVDQELIKALSHPIRVEILEKLQGRIASPVELSRELNESLDVVTYHAKTLIQCGCLELVRTEPRHGSREDFFEITSRSALRRN